MSVLIYTSRSITSLENLLLQASQLCGLHIEHVGDGERMTGLGTYGSDSGHRLENFTNRSDSLPEINSDSILSYPVRKPNIYSEPNFTVRSHYKMGAGTPNENGEYLPGSCDNWGDTDSLGSFTNRQRPTYNAPFPELNSESVFLYTSYMDPYVTVRSQYQTAHTNPAIGYSTSSVNIAELASVSDMTVCEKSPQLSTRPSFVPRLDLSALNGDNIKVQVRNGTTHRIFQTFAKKNVVVPTMDLPKSTSSSEISAEFLDNTFTANRFKNGQENTQHLNKDQNSIQSETSQEETPRLSLKKRVSKFFSRVFGCWKRKP